ncbi:hypothetical protein ASE17_02400 [Phenylobacterium sp. Root77]|uniref:bile acid:sodium symporter family protein n=1 Tax=unclassified Phenylobacterium TaxID=2640670 RepID=UPI0006F1DEF7|nr:MULTISPECIES: hypothetical protein [unclassified Phenylobacterium]KQW71755.1 hypothetical protein ASC73_06625 [Phenylobacterium sp. Root1277]KQW94675.1 hypothetical protein ASC79_02770 [Phenylobacterium sp. Root1290]KRC44368.1 hypothetical protein ASE17_02400 [Phenylobacterium sp. Root77]
MSLAELVPLVLKASIITMVFALGLTARLHDVISLAQTPGKLALSFLSMFVVMLAAAVAITRLFDLPRPVEIVLVALALAPIPPLLPGKQAKAGGDASYSIGLLVAASIFALVWIPLAMHFLSSSYHMPLQAGISHLAGVVGTMILAPLAAGAVLARLAPRFAAWIQPAFARVGSLLLLTAAVPILFQTWRPVIAQIGGGTLAALAVFIVIGLVVGQLLGGPDPDDRTVLALASSSRHPGIAMSLAALNFPGEKAVVAVVLLYLILSALLGLPYMMWRKRSGGTVALSV